METGRTYKVFYGVNYVCTVTAFSQYQAIDKVYYSYIDKYPHINRKLLTTK